MRTSEINRKTAETDIRAELNIDGTGEASVSTGVGFFDHMLVLFAKHGFMNLNLKADGDIQVDCHHTVEDVGIVLGQALAKALGGKAGIKRYGTAFVPMDEALVLVTLDISGRPFLAYDADVSVPAIGNYDCEMTEEFLRAFANHGGLTIHVKKISGKNAHHIVEAVFKALGRALDEATGYDERIKGVMSTKGML